MQTPGNRSKGCRAANKNFKINLFEDKKGFIIYIFLQACDAVLITVLADNVNNTKTIYEKKFPASIIDQYVSLPNSFSV